MNPSRTTAPRVALYARVSTLNQGQDTGLQLEELRQVAAQRGWIVSAEYVDEGVSGTKTTRPALDRMLADAQAGKFDLLAVWKLDRLGRSLPHLLTVLDQLASNGVGFAAIRDVGIDTTTPTGRLLLQLLGALADYERSLIRERVLAGVRRAQASGKHCGRPRKDVDLRVSTRRTPSCRISDRRVKLPGGEFHAPSSGPMGRTCSHPAAVRPDDSPVCGAAPRQRIDAVLVAGPAPTAGVAGVCRGAAAGCAAGAVVSIDSGVEAGVDAIAGRARGPARGADRPC